MKIKKNVVYYYNKNRNIQVMVTRVQKDVVHCVIKNSLDMFIKKKFNKDEFFELFNESYVLTLVNRLNKLGIASSNPLKKRKK